MEAVEVGRDLQMPALMPHRIVVGDDPLLVCTQNLGEVRADPRDKGDPASSAGTAKRRL
jgi:hypothetical protein